MKKQLNKALRHLERMANECFNGGYVVASENHVNVRLEDGLGGTAFAVRTAFTEPVIWNTKEEAEKYGCDYYLIDGAGNPIINKPMKATIYFQEEYSKCKRLIKFLNN